jgi:hypothetical protein
MSTFVAVGSGSRYEFTEQDIPTLQKRFSDWRSGNKASPPTTPKLAPAPRPAVPTRRQPSKKDRAVWEEEGIIQIEDIRNPRVRARVKANAQAAEDRLMMLLVSRGLHVTQLGDQRKATA